MTTIQIAYEVPATTVAEIGALLAAAAERQQAWNGAKFRVVRGDYTCIEHVESYDGVSLFHEIMAIIRKDEEEDEFES